MPLSRVVRLFAIFALLTAGAHVHVHAQTQAQSQEIENAVFFPSFPAIAASGYKMHFVIESKSLKNPVDLFSPPHPSGNYKKLKNLAPEMTTEYEQQEIAWNLLSEDQKKCLAHLAMSLGHSLNEHKKLPQNFSHFGADLYVTLNQRARVYGEGVSLQMVEQVYSSAANGPVESRSRPVTFRASDKCTVELEDVQQLVSNLESNTAGIELNNRSYNTSGGSIWTNAVRSKEDQETLDAYKNYSPSQLHNNSNTHK